MKLKEKKSKIILFFFPFLGTEFLHAIGCIRIFQPNKRSPFRRDVHDVFQYHFFRRLVNTEYYCFESDFHSDILSVFGTRRRLRYRFDKCKIVFFFFEFYSAVNVRAIRIGIDFVKKNDATIIFNCLKCVCVCVCMCVFFFFVSYAKRIVINTWTDTIRPQPFALDSGHFGT